MVEIEWAIIVTVLTVLSLAAIAVAGGLACRKLTQLTYQRRCRRIREEFEASRRPSRYQPFLRHIQPRHHHEFVQFLLHGEIVEGSSFEKAINTDPIYQTALDAAMREDSKELIVLLKAVWRRV